MPPAMSLDASSPRSLGVTRGAPRRRFKSARFESVFAIGFSSHQDLTIIIAMHHQRPDRELFQVGNEVSLREGDDAVVVCLRTSHHTLAPPILNATCRRVSPLRPDSPWRTD